MELQLKLECSCTQTVCFKNIVVLPQLFPLAPVCLFFISKSPSWRDFQCLKEAQINKSNGLAVDSEPICALEPSHLLAAPGVKAK